MVIKAVKLYENGYMLQPFAFGGEEGMEKFDPKIRYRSSLQNFLIDTGEEVILVDTGMPAEVPEQVPDEKTSLFMGNKISDYMTALETAGYKAEQVTKILITHKHADHSGEIRNFPNAEIYVGPEDADTDEMKGYENVIKATYQDGPYYNFPRSQKIVEGVYLIEAKGHTKGNSIVMVEDEGLFYMIHGDITYTDEALYENKLSIVYEDLPAARITMDQIRTFIANHPTIYLSTHTPLGYENLEARKICDLKNPPNTIEPAEIVFKTASGKYVCTICGYVYDPEEGDPDHGIPAGAKFEDLPDDWNCPRCKQGKDKFNKA